LAVLYFRLLEVRNQHENRKIPFRPGKNHTLNREYLLMIYCIFLKLENTLDINFLSFLTYSHEAWRLRFSIEMFVHKIGLWVAQNGLYMTGEARMDTSASEDFLKVIKKWLTTNHSGIYIFIITYVQPPASA
jgi:hypothetical protein